MGGIHCAIVLQFGVHYQALLAMDTDSVCQLRKPKVTRHGFLRLKKTLTEELACVITFKEGALSCEKHSPNEEPRVIKVW